MSTKYLEPGDPGAFEDWPQQTLDQLRDGASAQGLTKLCPVCAGHGGWNLKLNAYPLHRYADTAINRHQYAHFRAHCMHCNGWGWVSPDETCPGHQWAAVRGVGKCLTLYRCAVCGKEQVIDSSD